MKPTSLRRLARPLTLLGILFSTAALCRADAPATDAPAPASTNVFDVRAFGATGDGKTLDTTALQKAFDACHKAGGGTVRIPAGTYLSQPLKLGDKTTLQLDEGAVLLASPDQKDFMKKPGDWLAARSGGDFIPLLSGKDLTSLTVSGKGIIDGNGGVWWPEAEKARQRTNGFTLPRPNLFALQRCQNVRLIGITLRNSPKFHFVPDNCDDILVDGITILAPEGAANTDGIDPGDCHNVRITHCVFDVGDDDIAIKAGKKVDGREFGSENIEVTDCTFKHGHGMSIGSEVGGGVRNVTVRHCSFNDTDNGLRIKSRRGRGGRVENITYEDCTLTNCHPAISFMSYYQDSTRDKFPKDDKGAPVDDTTPSFRNLTIRNVTANSTVEAGYIVGLPESHIENVLLENVTLTCQAGLTIANATGVTLKNVKIIPATGDPYILLNAEVTGLPEVKK